MTRTSLRVAMLAAALPLITVEAQQTRVFTIEPREGVFVHTADANRALLGLTLASESVRGDTAGLLVDDVNEDGPSAKAGIKRGDRLQAINGVSLRADRADAGEEDYDGVLLRRLQREMAKHDAGDTVSLRVLSEGRSRDVRVATVSIETLYAGSRGRLMTRTRADERPVIGVSTQASGNARDTLGVFVASVTDEGPAAKAGIIEGDRIAAINGVSLRVAREDAGDMQVAAVKAERLRSELAKAQPGQAVELTVVSAGRSRTVRVTPVKASELPGYRASQVWGYGTTPEALEEAMARTRMYVPTPPTPPRPPAAPLAPAAPRVRMMLRDVREL